MKRYLTIIFTVFLVSFTYAKAEKKVLIVLTSHSELGDTGKQTGFWLPELTHPYYEFKKFGYTVDIASIKGGTAPLDNKILKIPTEKKSNTKFFQDTELMGKIFRTKALSEIDPKIYHVVFYAGGSGPMWDFPNNKHVKRITTSIYENGGVVAAVCHGQSALVNVKLSNGSYLVSGKKLTAFTNEEEKQLALDEIHPFLLQDILILRGADFIYEKPWIEKVVVDGRLVTGQNPASATEVAKKVIETLKESK